jgi:uncharacterized Zn-finger protein
VLTGGGGDYGGEPPSSAPVFPVCKRVLEPEQPDAPCENPHEGAALHLQLLPQVLHGSQQQAQTRAEQTCGSIRPLVILIKLLMLTPPVLSFVYFVAISVKVEVHVVDGTTSYVCTLCGKTSLHRKNIRRHVVIHLDRKPYSCHYCEQSFTDPSNRKRHEKRKHNL